MTVETAAAVNLLPAGSGGRPVAEGAGEGKPPFPVKSASDAAERAIYKVTPNFAAVREVDLGPETNLQVETVPSSLDWNTPALEPSAAVPPHDV